MRRKAGEAGPTPLKAAGVSILCFALPAISAVPAAGSQVDQIRPATWEIVSVASDGTQGDRDSGTACGQLDGPSMSDDSRYVVFSSEAGNLDPRDLNGSALSDVYLHDRRNDTTSLVSLTPRGVLPGGSNLLDDHCSILESGGLLGAHDPSISANGRFVAFADQRPMSEDDEDIGPVGADDVFVRDLRKGTTQLVSMTTSGEQIKGTHGFFGVAISGNGRYVAFTSSVLGLDEHTADHRNEIEKALGDTFNLCVDPETVNLSCPQQIFVHDREKGTTRLASVSSDGVPSDRNVDLNDFQISDDGRFVVFASSASNLDPDETNQLSCPLAAAEHQNCQDVFLHDLESGTTELISVDSQGTTGAGNSYLPVTSAPVVTPGGRYVVFHSFAALVPSTDESTKVYVRDRKTGRTEQVAVSSAGELMAQGHGASISDDGRYVFLSGSMRPGTVGCPDEAGCGGAVRYDRRTGQTDRIWSGVSGTFGASMGSAGRTFLRWMPDDQTYVAGDSNEAMDVFVAEAGVIGLGVDGATTGAKDRLTGPDGASLERTGVVEISDPAGDLVPGIAGADIIGARIAYRPQLGDLYVRIDVEELTTLRLPGLDAPSLPSLTWALDLTANGVRYQMRINGGTGPAHPASFGLFRCASAACTQVADLRGGFGTTGEAVVAAVPLVLLGLEDGGEISDLEAFSALGVPEHSQILDTAPFGE